MDTHGDAAFEQANRHLRLASRALADMKKANNDMWRWASQADQWSK
jgi:hypothetical protein